VGWSRFQCDGALFRADFGLCSGFLCDGTIWLYVIVLLFYCSIVSRRFYCSIVLLFYC
jgi:hypothetical protein